MKKANWKYLQRLIFFTGAFALILGVYQNLPAMDGIQQPNYMPVVGNVDLEYENMKGTVIRFLRRFHEILKEKLNDGIESRDTKYPVPADPEVFVTKTAKSNNRNNNNKKT